MANPVGYLDSAPIAQAIAQGISAQLDNIQRALEQNPVNVKPLVAEANKRLAQNMRRAVLHSYDQVVTARKRVPSYRQGENRFSGGQLRRALENSANYVANSQGIKFIDLDHMDATAAHWYRLNFGAAPAAGRAPYAFNWLFEGRSLGQLQLDWAPSEPFRMPAGFFVESGAFYPGKPRAGLEPTARIGRNTPTRGIGARRFLDAGLDRFSKDFSEVYGDVIIEIKDKKLAPLKNLQPSKVSAKIQM